MNQPPNPDPDSAQPDSEPKIEQDAQNNPGNVTQQAGAADVLNQQQNHNNFSPNNTNSAEFHVNLNFGEGLKDGKHKYKVFEEDNPKHSSDSEPFTDPTEQLPPKSRELPDFESDALQDNHQQLIEDCLIFISCFDQRIALAAAYALAHRIEDYDKRLLTERRNLKNADESSIETVLRPELGKGKSTLVVVDTNNMQRFLDSLVVRLLPAERIKNDLRNAKKLCICLVEPETLDMTVRNKQNELYFHCWEVPFMAHLLKEQFSCQGARDIEQEINRQKLQRLWGDTEKDFYELIRGYIRNGQLRQEVDKRKSIQTCKGDNKLSEEIEEVSAISLFENEDYLKQTVFYVSTFFSNLNLKDFEKIVLLLVGNQTSTVKSAKNTEDKTIDSLETVVSVTVGDETVTVNRPHKTKEGNDYQAINTRKEKLLSEVWKENPDEILSSCHLIYIRNEASSRVIDFSLPYLRKQFIDYFQQNKYAYHRNQFQKIAELGLLVDTSPQVAKNVRNMFVDMMVDSSEEYDIDWLNETILELIEQSNGETKKKLEYMLTCISNLLRETLNYPELEGLVNSVLEDLIGSKQHSTVLALAKRLRFAPQFEELYWINQLINRANEEVRLKAYQALYNQVKHSGSRVYEILEQIESWLPDLERDSISYSFSNKYALQLLPEYILETFDEFNQKFYGKEAFRYPLFGGLHEDDYAEHKLKLIADWLLHPGLEYVVNEDVDSLELVAILIIPELFSILYGSQKIDIDSETYRVASLFLQQINNVANFHQETMGINKRKLLLELWNGWSNILLAMIKGCRSSEKPKQVKLNEEKYYNNRRNVVRNIIKQFTALPKI